MHGGHEGGINRLFVRPSTDKEEILTERASFFGPFFEGEVISCRSAGGGGYGNPLERDPERVGWEVLNQILTALSFSVRMPGLGSPPAGESGLRDYPGEGCSRWGGGPNLYLPGVAEGDSAGCSRFPSPHAFDTLRLRIVA